MHYRLDSLRISERDFTTLLRLLGPSLGLWRAAEIAALRQVHLTPPVVDLGCGDGLVTSYVLPSVAVGVDPDLTSINKAEARGLYKRLENSEIQKARIRDCSIGTVVSNSVLEHIENIDAALRRVARILRPGGRLVFTVPSEYFSGSLALPLRAYRRSRNRRFTHINLWDVKEWERRLAGVGLHLEFTRLYLRPSLVRLWDALELLQQVRVYRWRLFGVTWRRLPNSVIRRMGRNLSKVDFACDAPGGGRLMVAVKHGSFVPPDTPSDH